MEAKEEYLEQAEKKVRNLLSELYESESETQKELVKTKAKQNPKITYLETQYSETRKKRRDLQQQFEHLRSVDDVQWDNTQKEFDSLLEYVESNVDSNKVTFIEKTESVMMEQR